MLLFFLLLSQKFGYSDALFQFCRKRRRLWIWKRFMKRCAGFLQQARSIGKEVRISMTYAWKQG